MRAAPRPLLALPYALELNDSVIHAVEKHATGEFGRRLDHTLNVYAREAAASGMPRVLTLGLHPHLMGVPHRYPDFEAMLDRLQRHSMTRFVTGAELYAWYADQCSPPLRAGRPGMSGAQTTAARDAEPSQPAASAIDALVAHLQRLRYEDLPAGLSPPPGPSCWTPSASGCRARATRAWRRSSKPPPRWARAPRPRSGPAANGCRWPARSCSTPTRSSTRNSTRSMTAPWCTPSPASRPPRWAMPSARGGVDGRRLITAVAAGLDFAIHVALAQRAPMRFFRPAMCGGLGATATLCKLAGLDEAATRDALGLAYSHLSGTMQAHIEGSPAVGLQVGLNARAAVTAFELARAGFPGPRDILEGPFGYFALYDAGQARWDEVAGDVGRVFQIARMSHKPYPPDAPRTAASAPRCG